MKNNKKKNIIKILKIQAWITGLFLVAYLLVLSFGERGVFLVDLNNKKRVAGAMVSATLRIFGPPEKPIIMGNATCNNEGSSVVSLNWVRVADATAYDVYRDGELVASNLADTFFIDRSISNNINYFYYLIAKGPAGEAVSEEANFLTKNCKPIILPVINFSTFEGKNISGMPTTINKRPLVQGQTNMPFSTVELEIHSDLVFYATVQTNANGYWQWSPSADIPYGAHILYAKVIDNNDASLFATNFLFFAIIEAASAEDDDEDEDENEKELKKTEIYPTAEDIIRASSQKDEAVGPFELNISLEGSVYIKGVSVAGEAYRGENLKTLIEFDSLDMAVGGLIDINYVLIDSSGNTITRYSQREILKEGLQVERMIPLPQELKLGRYKIEISATVGNMTVSNESTFILKDRPLLKIGATTYLTYHDLVGNLSWLFIGSTSFLSFFSIAAMREHYLYKRAVFHITEKVLKRRGFIN